MAGTAHIEGGGAPLTGRTDLGPEARVRLQRAAQDFEALFLGYLMKSMRAASPAGDEGGGFGGDMMMSLADMQFAQHLSRSRPLGVADMVYKSVTGEPMPKAGRPVPRPAPAGAVRTSGTDVKAVDASPRPAPGVPAAHAGQASPAATETPRPAMPGRSFQAVAERVSTFVPYITQASAIHSVDGNLIKAVIAAESSGKPDAVSPKKAKGLMQLIDGTARAMGVRNVLDPRENILGGTRYLKELLDRFSGDVRKALAGYNAGPGAVQRHGGIPPFPETQRYVEDVLKYFDVFSQQKDDVDGNE
jgi:Rod binding domain-containing protein